MEKKYYELNLSQHSVLVQWKYTFSKNVINILASLSFEKEVDWDVMEKAFNLCIERNDSMRLRFEKVGKEIKQYFVEHDSFENIPRLKIKTKEEFDSLYYEKRKKAISFLKGVVVEPYFIENYDGKNMVLIKVCHLVLDSYGVGLFFNDLMNVYKALVENTEMPKQLGSFEELLSKELKTAYDPALRQKHFDFYDAWLEGREMPQYAGFHGDRNLKWKKKRLKGKMISRSFFNYKTNNQAFILDNQIVSKITDRAAATGQSLAVFMNYCYAVTLSMINGFPKHLFSLDLCNCRGTMLEKTTCATRVKNNVSFPDIDWDKCFDENVAEFSNQHNEMFKHIYYPDEEFSIKLLHKHFDYGYMAYIDSYAFSLVALKTDGNAKITIYSNGNSAFNCYVFHFYDVTKNVFKCAYDYKTVLMTDEDIRLFHNLYEKVINTVLDNPDKPLKPLLEGLIENSGF